MNRDVNRALSGSDNSWRKCPVCIACIHVIESPGEGFDAACEEMDNHPNHSAEVVASAKRALDRNGVAL